MDIKDITRHFTELPPKGVPAADLTDRDRIALALAAGVPCEFIMEGTMMRIKSKVPFGIADRGDGGYIVAHR